MAKQQKKQKELDAKKKLKERERLQKKLAELQKELTASGK